MPNAIVDDQPQSRDPASREGRSTGIDPCLVRCAAIGADISPASP
jgi:hypothetical protein